jgi:hypothetical protein
MATILLALPSCKSHSSVQCTVDSLQSKVSQSQLSTINCQLSTAIRDSIVLRERTIHDTVYITKEVYRDKQLSTLNSQLSTISDTVHIVEYRDRIIEHPPERFIPPFYKHCTVIFWILIVGIVIYVILRIKSSAFRL